MFYQGLSRARRWLRHGFARAQAAAPPRSLRLAFDRLEDRTLLSASPATATLLVQTKVGFAPAQMASWLAHQLPQGDSLQATHIAGLFEIQAPPAQLAALATRLRANSHVAYVQKSSTVHVALTPNDPQFTDGTLYGLNGTYGIKADQAWDFTTGATTVTVAVIDTGVDYAHPDLYKNIWINQGEIPASVKSAIQSDPAWDVDGDGLITFWDLNDPRNQGAGKITDLDGDGRISAADILKPVAQGGWADNSDNDSDGYRDDLVGWNYVNNTNNPFDDNHHGTHVAGTIGAIGNNATGVVGVNWKTLIMPLKFLDSTGNGSDADGAVAIHFAADHGARVSNNSYGDTAFSSTMYNAINYAAGKNHLFVAAAGNSSQNTDITPNYPSAYNLPNIVAVAATTSSGALAGFSNYGPTTVDVGAPGVNIYSTFPGNSYGYLSGTSMATPHAAGAAALILAHDPGLSYAALKDRLLSHVTPLSSLAGITVTGGLVNAFDAVKVGPEISVFDGGTNLADGASTVAFGTAFLGSPVSKTFTVTNIGDQPLTLTTPINVPSGFTVTSSFGTTTLAAGGGSTTFTVRLDAAAVGSYSGALSFANNDANENPFNFTVTGTVTYSVSIMDDGATGFSTVGNWTAYPSQGYQNDIHYSPAGSGSDVASWTFAVTPGVFRVSATWYPSANRATDAPFTVLDGSTPLATLRLNQQLTPNDFTDAGASWQNVGGNYAIFGNTLVVQLSNNANQYVIADAIRVQRISDLSSGPEIEALDGSIDLVSGSATVGYGSIQVGTPLSKTFTVRNLGSQNLTLGAISVPAGFTVSAGFGATTVTPGASTTVTVRLEAAAAGSYSGQLSFGDNDPDENPFHFTIQGTVTPAPTVQIIDDGDASFSTSGSWSPYANQGFQSDIHYSAAGNGSSVATWSFTVTPGIYRVSATWNALSNRATDAPFTVLDGTNPQATVRLNQQLSPNDFTDAGVGWKDIGGNYSIFGNTLVVQLANNANQYVIADAVRVERLSNLPSGPEIQVLLGSADLTSGSATVNYGSTPVGTPLSKTFTVRNLGSQDLTLGAISVPAGFTVTLTFGATTVTAGATTTFTVRLDAAATGSYSGQFSFGNNDSNENPFHFTLQGTVMAAPVLLIIDDGDSGFSTVGIWTLYPNQGYQNDIHYSAAGDGSSAATWSFTVPSGLYHVSATWNALSNRATDAPFTVLDGSSSLGTVRLNQQVSPNDFTDAGVGWKDIGNYSIYGTTLVVQLANNANQYVIADAIRVERVGDVTNGPEIQVLNGGSDIPDGSGSVSFGTVFSGAVATKTFTVKNVGNSALNLGSTVSLPGGYTLASGFGTTTVAPGSSTTFTVQFSASAAGTYAGTLSFTNDNADENPFDFTVTTTVTTVQIIDDGDAGFSTQGSWTPYPNQGYQNDIHYSAAGTGSDVATWTFTVTPGTYRVSATWNALPNRATNSPFTVFDGGNPLATIAVNQQLSPSDFTDAGVAWKNLGGPYTITGNTLIVRLSNNANQYVIADAIRIERL